MHLQPLHTPCQSTSQVRLSDIACVLLLPHCRSDMTDVDSQLTLVLTACKQSHQE